MVGVNLQTKSNYNCWKLRIKFRSKVVTHNIESKYESNSVVTHMEFNNSIMTPFLFYFTFYLNLNQKASKMTKKPKDFKILTDPCHSYPIQNPTHNPTRFLTLIIFLLPLLLPFSPLMFLSLLHFKTKSKFKEKIFTDFLFFNPKLIDPQSKLINSILFEIKFHL